MWLYQTQGRPSWTTGQPPQRCVAGALGAEPLPLYPEPTAWVQGPHPGRGPVQVSQPDLGSVSAPQTLAGTSLRAGAKTDP